MGRRRSPEPKPKKLTYELLTRTDHRSKYKAVDTLIEAHHEDLKDARYALAWCTSWKPDADGRQKLGACRRASSLDRELAPYDFVILLNKDFYTSDEVSDEQRHALVDHELMHITLKLDPRTHEPVEDACGRKLYRTVKHNIEEFSEIVERHGIWKKDIERFAQALARSKQGRLPIDSAPPASSHLMTH